MPDELAPREMSFLGWLFTTLGPVYTLCLLLVALVAFVLTLIVVVRGKGGMGVAALAFIVPAPLFVGVLGAVNIARVAAVYIASSCYSPKPHEIANGCSESLLALLAGLILMGPSFAVAMVGLFVRGFGGSAEQSKIVT